MSAIRTAGKTFRLVLSSLIKASEGKNIIYVSNTRAHLSHAEEIARRVIPEYSDDIITTNNKITFPNGGCVIFFRWTDDYAHETRGIKNIEIVRDM